MFGRHTTVIKKEPLSIDESRELSKHIEEKKLEALPHFVATLNNAAIDQNYFRCLQTAVPTLAAICAALTAEAYYDFLTQHAAHLVTLGKKFTVCIDHAAKTDTISDDEAQSMRDTITDIHQHIIQACLHVSKSKTPIHTKENHVKCIFTIINSLSTLCFTDTKPNPGLKIPLDELHQCAKFAAHYIIEHAHPCWPKLIGKPLMIQQMKTELLLLIITIKQNSPDKAAMETTDQLCEAAMQRINGLTTLNKATPLLMYSKPRSMGISRDEHLSQVRVVFSDFDDTLYLLSNQIIPPRAILMLNILHFSLKIPVHVITARNQEMEEQACYHKDLKTQRVTHYPQESKNTIASTIEKNKLSEIIPKENIIYCNFYTKIAVNNEEAYTHYFCYTDDSKSSKVDDFLSAAERLKIDPKHTAVLDDSPGVWPGINGHTQNFFLVDNASSKTNIVARLGTLITQLVLYGEHLPEQDRISGAQEACKIEDLFIHNEKELKALQTFVMENNHPSKKAPRPI